MRARIVLALAVAVLAASPAWAVDPLQSLYRKNKAGNQALANENTEEALRHYADAQAVAPNDPRVLFNLGNALAQAGRHDEAEQAWQRAQQLARGELKRDTAFNRGVAAFGGQKYQDAVRDFAQALTVDAHDAEAKRNLELALRALQQQQQQQQQQQNSQKQDQNKQDQKQQGDKNQDASSKQPSGPEQKQQDQKQQDQQKQGQQPKPDQNPQQSQGGNDAEQKAAQRVLDRLGDDEKNALKRALKQSRHVNHKSREKDW